MSIYNRLAQQIRAAAGRVKAAKTQNADRVAGYNVAGLRALVTRSSIGLDQVPNVGYSPLNNNGADDDTDATTLVINERVYRSFKKPYSVLHGTDGQFLWLDGIDWSSLVPSNSLKFTSVVTTEAELQTLLSTEEKMSDVFNSWKRISRGDWTGATSPGLSDTAFQTELDAFTYNATTGLIENPSDTKSLVGFICPNGYENYVLDVVLKSNSTWQNDPLGLIVGYVQDSDGTTHTLSIMRNLWYPSYATYGAVDVVVDYNTPAQTLIKTQRAGLKWVDGTDAAGAMNPTSSPWAVKPWNQAPNGCRLKITRAGDTFTVETTNYDETAFVAAAKFSFTLNDHASLARFKGPCRYGYAAISQDYAIWDVKSRPGARQSIVDIRDHSVREWNGTAWVVIANGWDSTIEPNKFYYNRTTKRLFYAENETTLLSIL